MGRRPVPTALKKLRGNPGKRHLPKNDAQPRKGIPHCPQHIQGEGRREWRRVVGELASCGLMTYVDRAALAAYCQAWDRWVMAEDVLRSAGVLIKTPTGMLVQSPMLAVANHAMNQMRAFLCEFGMTPAARTRIKAEFPEEDKDPLDVLRVYGERMN